MCSTLNWKLWNKKYRCISVTVINRQKAEFSRHKVHEKVPHGGTKSIGLDLTYSACMINTYDVYRSLVS